MRSVLPESIKHISQFFQRLPGIGQKTAQRLAFYLLRMPEEDLKSFGAELASLKSKIHRCPICHNLTEEDGPCLICTDKTRDEKQIIVVETVLDLLALETGNIYKGQYHVLNGRIDPLNHIGPDDLYIEDLVKRVEKMGKKLKEIILATNPDMEGEATAMYIRDRLKELKEKKHLSFKISRLAYGLPIGASLEYAGYMTLEKSIEGRKDF